MPSAVVYSNTFDWNGVADVAVTVTHDDPSHPGMYMWNYHVTNESFASGIGTFAVPVEEPWMVSNVGNNLGWMGSVGTLMGNPNLVSWQAIGSIIAPPPGSPPSPPPPPPPLVGVGGSADFWFTTIPTDLALTNGIVSDLGLTSLPAGFVAAPVPRQGPPPPPSPAPWPAILVTTTADKDDPNVGMTSLREAIDWVNRQNLTAQQLQVRFVSGQTGAITLGALEQLDITSNIFINGAGRNITIQRDANFGDFRLIEGSAASTIKLAGLLLTNGQAACPSRALTAKSERIPHPGAAAGSTPRAP